MAERANSELFTKNSLKLQSGSFIIQSGIQDFPDIIEVKTSSQPILGTDNKDEYRGSTTESYDLPVVSIRISSSNPIGEWTTTISDKTVRYTVSSSMPNTLYRAVVNVQLMGETTLVLPYNIQAILNGVIVVGDVEYVFVQPHKFNLEKTIVFEDSKGNKIEWSKKDHTTWTTLTKVDLRKSSVFLTYLV